MFGINQIIGAALIGAAVVGFVAFGAYERNKGTTGATRKIERATDNAISKGKRAATASASDGVHGKRDPSTRDD